MHVGRSGVADVEPGTRPALHGAHLTAHVISAILGGSARPMSAGAISAIGLQPPTW